MNSLLFFDVCQGLNSHYFHRLGMAINPIVGVYIPIIRIPIKGGMSLSPIKRDNLDHGTMCFLMCFLLMFHPAPTFGK